MTALVNIASNFTPPPHREGRNRLYRLRASAARLLREERVAWCGRRARLGHVDVRCGEGRASYGGVETCASVWVCPACASKIAEERRKEVRALADDHCRKGGSIYMAAFTLRHKHWQSATELRQAVTKSWSKMIAGAPWKRAMEKAGCVGGVRALEVTHGKNGWHPHLHVVFFLDHEIGADDFGIWLFERWCKIVERAGFGECNPDIWRFERAAHHDAVTDYVVKGNFDMELTRGHMKLAKGGGRSPWQLLTDAAEGDRRAAWLFRDFAKAFKGARQLTWFGDLREARSDLEIANADEPAELLGTIPSRTFGTIMHHGLGAALLDAAEAGGWQGVVDFLKREGLDGSTIDGSFAAAARGSGDVAVPAVHRH